MIRFAILILTTIWTMASFANHHESMAKEEQGCKRPDADITVPDGATASRDAMLQAKDGVQNFVSKGEMYVDCMAEQIEALRAEVEAAMTEEGEEKSPDQKATEKEYRDLVRAHDAVVGEMQDLASEFNQALSDYNEQAD